MQEGMGRRGWDIQRACKDLGRLREGVSRSRAWGIIGKAWERRGEWHWEIWEGVVESGGRAEAQRGLEMRWRT